jgi:hypothetical protein
MRRPGGCQVCEIDTGDDKDERGDRREKGDIFPVAARLQFLGHMGIQMNVGDPADEELIALAGFDGSAGIILPRRHDRVEEGRHLSRDRLENRVLSQAGVNICDVIREILRPVKIFLGPRVRVDRRHRPQEIALHVGIGGHVLHHPRHPVYIGSHNIVIHFQDLAHGRIFPEILPGHGLREDDRVGVADRRLRVALQKRKSEDFEEIRIRQKEAVLLDDVVAQGDEGIGEMTEGQEAGDLLERGDVPFQMRDKSRSQGRESASDRTVRAKGPALDPDEPIGVLMEFVIARFVPDEDHDRQADGHSDRQTGDVDEGVAALAPQIADRYFQVIF